MNPKNLHPELESLILEATDERSGRVLVSLASSATKLTTNAPTSSGGTSLEKLEAKLVQKYREALADLYWHAGEKIIFTAPATAKYLKDAQRVRRTPDLSDEAAWRTRAAALLRAPLPARERLPKHLERLTRIMRGEQVSLAATARAGFELLPLSDFRIHEAWAHEASGELALAKRQLQVILEASAVLDDRGRALNNLGHIAGLEGDLSVEFACYQQASKLLPREGPTIFHFARLAINVGSHDSVPTALEQIETLAQASPVSFTSCLQALRAEALASTPLVPTIPRSLREHAGPSAIQFLELLR